MGYVIIWFSSRHNLSQIKILIAHINIQEFQMLRYWDTDTVEGRRNGRY